MIPWECLVRGNGAVCQSADEGMDADLATAGAICIPVVVILVLAQETVVGANVPLQAGIVGPGGVNHDALDGNLAACLIAGILGENQFTTMTESGGNLKLSPSL